jgi:hypothetical protein
LAAPGPDLNLFLFFGVVAFVKRLRHKVTAITITL